MASVRNGGASELSADDLELLLRGPHACGLEGGYRAPAAQHSRLRGLWRQHGPAVEAEAKRRGLTAWYLDRDAFVCELERQARAGPPLWRRIG